MSEALKQLEECFYNFKKQMKDKQCSQKVSMAMSEAENALERFISAVEVEK
ncbi:MAG: hypothetical protein NTW78_04040 [Campylobacterales bacterium]|nr:hypothetical protein [Campylobacterales bacterium]